MFANECWWITGASSGIGAALALGLAARGASVVLSGRNVGALEAVARDCADALVLPFEATDFDAVPAIAERAWAWKGRIHGLVNNAGVSQRSLAVETAFAVYQKMIAIDLLAPIALTQAVLPRMVRAGGGRIVAMSSVAGFVGAPLRSAYSAAKHGLVGYHDSVRAENEHLGIRVHVFAPGSVRTNVSRNALLADGSARGASDAAIENGMPAAEAAEAMLVAIADGKRELILASGMEHEVVMLRRRDPEALFERMSMLVRAGYAQSMASDTGES
ncbi:MAG: SDR family NAD(P)-dependent oxidoreductase [Deltaproteobacteria bacterium]|nr:SDR family NAD(P)-dependent oxidoreductase [Deltaproteobacteria bacterium]